MCRFIIHTLVRSALQSHIGECEAFINLKTLKQQRVLLQLCFTGAGGKEAKRSVMDGIR